MSAWLTRAPEFQLSPHDVHIIMFSISSLCEQEALFLSWLDETEKVRAQRFYFQKDTTRFIVTHGMLRFILSQYLQAHPRTWRFTQGEYGKPVCQQNQHFAFNLSHSGDLALIACGIDQQCGVDIEQHRDCDYMGIAERFFAESEVSIIEKYRQQSWQAFQTIFFAFWTAKEAFIKAIGQGLHFPLRDVVFHEINAYQLAIKQLPPEYRNHWQLYHLPAVEDYNCTFASNIFEAKLFTWCWQAHMTELLLSADAA